MAYIELVPGETLTVAFAGEDEQVHEGPRLVIAYTVHPYEVKAYYEAHAPAPGEPTLRLIKES